jgi:hypothetical protein
MEERDKERGAFMWADRTCDDFKPKQEWLSVQDADQGSVSGGSY